MKNIYFFIDDFNFYHSVNHPKFFKYKWLNYRKLAEILLKNDEKIEKVLFFTAFATWDPEKVKRHKILIQALASVAVETILGKFKIKKAKCRLCCQIYELPIEKQTDVNIAVNLMKFALLDKFDKAYIVSGDTDLIPAIKIFKESFPSKEICIVFPFARRGKELKSVCDLHIKIKEHHLISSIFPENISLKDDTLISRPKGWQ